MSFETVVLGNLKKYKVLAIVGVFVSFFVVVGILNYFQKVTLEGFVTLSQSQNVEKFGAHPNGKKEKFGGCGNHKQNQQNQQNKVNSCFYYPPGATSSR